MTTLGDLASVVRSKNAGPFWITIDVFLPDRASYDRAIRAAITDPGTLARMYAVDPEQVKVFRLPDLLAVKVSFPRPNAQGSRAERDMHAGQQYVPLLDLEIPE